MTHTKDWLNPDGWPEISLGVRKIYVDAFVDNEVFLEMTDKGYEIIDIRTMSTGSPEEKKELIQAYTIGVMDGTIISDNEKRKSLELLAKTEGLLINKSVTGKLNLALDGQTVQELLNFGSSRHTLKQSSKEEIEKAKLISITPGGGTMTKYVKTRNAWVISSQTDYGNPLYEEWEDTWSPSEVWQLRMEVAITTATTIDLAPFLSATAADTDIVKIRVRNLDATNYVLVKCRQSKASVTYGTGELGFTNTAPVTITDTTEVFLTSLYAKAGDYVTVSGCTDQTANNQTSLIQTAVAATLTLQEDVTQATETDEDGLVTLEVISENEIKLKAGEMCEFSAVMPAHDIVLIADTAACEVDIHIIGS